MDINPEQLKKEYTHLQNICSKIDPYQPLNQDLIEELRELNIEEWENPLDLTNQLLLKLEKLKETIQGLKNEIKQ